MFNIRALTLEKHKKAKNIRNCERIAFIFDVPISPTNT